MLTFSAFAYGSGTMRRDVLECGVQVRWLLQTEWITVCGIHSINPFPLGLDYRESVMIYMPTVGFFTIVLLTIGIVWTFQRTRMEIALASGLLLAAPSCAYFAAF